MSRGKSSKLIVQCHLVTKITHMNYESRISFGSKAKRRLKLVKSISNFKVKVIGSKYYSIV